MLARVARFDHLPDDLDGDAVDTLRQILASTPGYVAGFHLLDRTTRKALSITVFEDHDALQRAGHALAGRPDDRTVGIAPTEVELYEEAHAF
jgi:hypothetical protein